MINIFECTGKKILSLTQRTGEALKMLLQSLLFIPYSIKWDFSRIIKFMHFCGVESIPVVSLTAIFTGMVMALQTGHELTKFGLQASIGDIIGASMCREMGPVQTAIIIAARVGSSIAAELGTMKVSEEIDALEVMTINPTRFLVTPRLIGMALMIPILTIYANIVGIIGGGIIGYYQIGLPYELYFRRAFDFLELKDIYSGLLKALVFSITICTIACYQGMNATEGARGVGRATTRTVVYSFLLIIIFDYFITSFFY